MNTRITERILGRELEGLGVVFPLSHGMTLTTYPFTLYLNNKSYIIHE